MCGIVGIVNTEDRQNINSEILNRMCNSLRHRGPDDEGYFVNGSVGLGMRRLSIIDVKGGHQPIHNEDKNCWIVFNGEIYNYLEIRQMLENKGHQFYTRTDTEVIVHLYEEYGDECVKHLCGMFAFAIWDELKRKLFLARDRLGEKPLFYTYNNGRFAFGSELKSLLTLPWVKRRIDFKALSDFFSFLYVPAPDSIFSGIKKLPAAHTLTIEDRTISIQRYWEVGHIPLAVNSEEFYIERLLELLGDSIKRRLMSEVPLGVFLSGGVDSSLVVALLSQMVERPVETFTIGYERENKYYDERYYARTIAEQFRTNHHEFVVQPHIKDVLPEVIRCFDEPFADSSAIPNYYLCGKTKQHVTVALSGLGADELAAGYERYVGVILAQLYHKVPKVFREVIGKVAKKVPDSKSGALFNQRIKRFVDVANLPQQKRYFAMTAAFSEEEKEKLFSPDLLSEMGDEASEELITSYFESSGSFDVLTQMLFADLKTYLVDDLLTLTDRTSMAHSLEVRVPFLDHKLVELFFSMPADLKLKGFKKKYILKRAAERMIPKNIIYRQKKGFSVPLALWFRNELRQVVEEGLSEKKLNGMGYFNQGTVDALLQEHLACKQNHENKIWALLNFSMWHKTYVEECQM